MTWASCRLKSQNRQLHCWFCGLFKLINTLKPRRNEQHFADDIFKRIFFNENVWISIEISLKFVPKGPINNIPALVQIMVWRRSGDKPLSETNMVSLPTHICVTRPQWVKITKALYYMSFVRGFQRWPVDPPHKGPIIRQRLAMSRRFHGPNIRAQLRYRGKHYIQREWSIYKTSSSTTIIKH